MHHLRGVVLQVFEVRSILESLWPAHKILFKCAQKAGRACVVAISFFQCAGSRKIDACSLDHNEAKTVGLKTVF